jgi:uncharacterized membrane protein
LAQRHPVLVLAVAAALLLSPSLVLGTLISHSSPQNLTWASQFSEQFRAGVLYPRWMPESFDGLGSPAFYFYPPVPFWIDALVSVATFNLLSVPYRLAATTALILFASGLTMRAWLQQTPASPTAALVGAVAYMAAPYHLLDHYTRGAFAEFTAYALLPLVMLAIRQTVEDRRWGLPFLAASYAALLASHLPTALLCSVTVIPAYVLFSTRSPARLLRCAAGGVLGLGLAAAYLVPALELQEWISSDQLWAPFYRPENWFVLVPARWGDPDTMRTITSIALALAVLALGLCVALLQMPVADARRKELGFWIALSLACLVLVVGLLPWFWDLPLIGKVQFPWRLMMVVEFAAITALCLVPFSKLRRVVVYIFAAAAAALVPAAVSVASDAAARIDLVRHGGALDQHDVKEYQPRGFKLAGPRYADLGLEALKGVPAISCMPAVRTCRAESERFGAMRVTVESAEPTTVVLRRFFFPAWRVDTDVALAPTDSLRLVSLVVPAGRTEARLDRVSLSSERWGWTISGLSLLLLLATMLISARSNARG